MIHGKHPCATCPFRRIQDVGWFPPRVLDETVGVNLRGEQHAHRCHQTLNAKRENVCVGFLRHVRDHGIPNRMVAFGQALGIIDYDRISDDVDIASSWEEVLEIHRNRAAE